MLPNRLGTMSWSSTLPTPICAPRKRFNLVARLLNARLTVTNARSFKEGVMAMGAVTRDNNHNVIMSSCNKKQIEVEPCTVEAMAIECDLHLACHLNLKKIVL